MNYLFVITFFLLVVCLYIKRDTVIVKGEKLGYLMVAMLCLLAAFFLLFGFLGEFTGIFFLLFMISLLIGFLVKR